MPGPNSTVMEELPEGIELERNRDLHGWMRSLWWRRALLCCVAALNLRRGLRRVAHRTIVVARG